MSRSASEWLVARFAPARFVPLAGLFAVAAAPADARDFIATTARALLILLALRLEHDLAKARVPRRAIVPFLIVAGLTLALEGERLLLVLAYAIAALGHRWPRLHLCKYALVVLVLTDGRATFAAVAIYLAFVIHEVLHDPRTWAAPLLFEGAALALWPLAWRAPLVSLVVAAGLVPLFLAHRARRAPGRWCEAVFLLGAIEVLSCPA